MTLQIIFGYIIFIMILVTAIYIYFQNVPVSEEKKKVIIKNAMMMVFVLILAPFLFNIVLV